MQIHELKVKPKKGRKRIGRGGKRGTFSGKGMKGQKARSGAPIDPLFQGGSTSLMKRMKKIRGFKAVTPKKNVFNLKDIELIFKDGETVTMESLIKAGILRKSEVKQGVKILGTGELTKKVTISEEILVSDSAAAAIKKVGGAVNVAEAIDGKKKLVKRIKEAKTEK